MGPQDAGHNTHLYRFQVLLDQKTPKTIQHRGVYFCEVNTFYPHTQYINYKVLTNDHYFHDVNAFHQYTCCVNEKVKRRTIEFVSWLE